MIARRLHVLPEDTLRHLIQLKLLHVSACEPGSAIGGATGVVHVGWGGIGHFHPKNATDGVPIDRLLLRPIRCGIVKVFDVQQCADRTDLAGLLGQFSRETNGRGFPEVGAATGKMPRAAARSCAWM